MGGNVFANGLEISGKAVDAKTIAAMPDVCFTPPENPATPPGVPIPYPSFGMASDTESGTATVLISGEIVNIKNKSDESKTSGTEAGCAAKKGVITSKNTGKKYFNSWSTDVKFEGEPVIRFSDLATHNHASPVGNAPPWPEIIKPAMPSDGKDPCEKEKKAEETACGDKTTEEVCEAAGLNLPPGEENKDKSSDGVVQVIGGVGSLTSTKPANMDASKGQFRISKSRNDDWKRAQANECLRARRCKLNAFKDEKKACCPKQTAHHVIPKSSFVDTNASGKSLAGCGGYEPNDAPCVCAEGASSTKGSHGMMHNFLKVRFLGKNADKSDKFPVKKITMSRGKAIDGRAIPYKDMRDLGIASIQRVFPNSNCTTECLKAQLDSYHQKKGVGIKDDTPLRADTRSGREEGEASNALAALDDFHAKISKG